jgi:hypothetical protein
VKGIKEPISAKEKKYTAWQEACRKDIERAFGVLKGTWQCLGRPIYLQGLQDISEMVATCLLLHNMLVTDRVMASKSYNFRQRYDPSNTGDEKVIMADSPTNMVGFENRTGVEQGCATANIGVSERTEVEQQSVTGVASAPLQVQQLVTRADRFKELRNKEENERLHRTLMDVFGK